MSFSDTDSSEELDRYDPIFGTEGEDVVSTNATLRTPIAVGLSSEEIAAAAGS